MQKYPTLIVRDHFLALAEANRDGFQQSTLRQVPEFTQARGAVATAKLWAHHDGFMAAVD